MYLITFIRIIYLLYVLYIKFNTHVKIVLTSLQESFLTYQLQV